MRSITRENYPQLPRCVPRGRGICISGFATAIDWTCAHPGTRIGNRKGPPVRFKYVPLVVHVADQGAPFRMSLCKPLFGMAFSLADGELEWHGSALPPGQTYEPPRAHSFRHLRRGRWVGAAGGFAPSRPNGRLLLPLPFRAPGALSSEGGRPRPPGLMRMARATAMPMGSPERAPLCHGASAPSVGWVFSIWLPEPLSRSRAAGYARRTSGHTLRTWRTAGGTERAGRANARQPGRLAAPERTRHGFGLFDYSSDGRPAHRNPPSPARSFAWVVLCCKRIVVNTNATSPTATTVEAMVGRRETLSADARPNGRWSSPGFVDSSGNLTHARGLYP